MSEAGGVAGRRPTGIPAKASQQGDAPPPASPVVAEARCTDRVDFWARIITPLSLVLIIIGAVLTYASLQSMMEGLRAERWVRLALVACETLMLVNVAALGWRIILVRRYDPIETCNDEELPEITVVVPAYNEGKGILDTLSSLVASHYPSEKLTVIAVDDGSVDDTWQWMQQAANQLGGQVEVIHCPTNRGKRSALHEGFLRSSGEVIVTVDSDSVVTPQALRHMVSPFVRDPVVGAVAGNVSVWNRNDGIIPRMLDVSYTYSFDFIRAGQSHLNTVMCTPGALSAYRRAVVMRVLPEWINQVFLGRRANIGEDRAMTNMILRSGYNALYESRAVVYTKTPTRYRGLCRMLLRWARSNVRETLIMSSFIFRRFRSGPALGARVNFAVHSTNLVLQQVLRGFTIYCIVVSPAIFGIHIALTTSIVSTIPAVVYALRHRNANGLWAMPYGLFWTAGLSWILPYAMLTLRKTSWLTRHTAPKIGAPKGVRLKAIDA
ncbi:MAG: glycosyltransferase [Acidobacteriota bacterium]